MVSFTQVSGAAIDSSTPSSEGSAETGTVVYETGLVDSLLKTIIEPLRQAVGPALDIIEEFLNKVVMVSEASTSNNPDGSTGIVENGLIGSLTNTFVKPFLEAIRPALGIISDTIKTVIPAGNILSIVKQIISLVVTTFGQIF
ncbi:hypothetical protein JTB14_004800 [Gonioctena quinquepunctata]|nr:hypothetical protein JTB14_004800 [Gonioctena quinquepunctata]